MKNLAGIFGAAVVALGSWCAFGETLTPANYAKKIEITLSDDAKTALGENTLSDFPVLVRLSTSIESFSYADFKGENGSDLRFALEDGTLLSSEIDTWDQTGTSLVWVKVPILAASSKIIAYYGNSSPDAMTPSDTWSGYVGVWHFKPSEAGGTTVSDATANALNATTTKELVAYDGPMGVSTLNSGAVVQASDYDSKLTSAKIFSACGWFKCPDQVNSYISFVHKKVGLSWNDSRGWYIELPKTTTSMNLVLNGTKSADIPDVRSNWNFFYITSDGSTVKVYMNGATSPKITWGSYTIKESGTAFNIATSLSISDEYRVLNSTASALRTSIEYKTMKDAAFCVFSEVQSIDATAVKFDGKSVVAKAADTFMLSVTTAANSGPGTITAKYGTSDLYDLSAVMTSAAEVSKTYEVALSGLSTDTSYKARAEGENDKGTITKADGDKVFYNGTLAIAAGDDADEKLLSTPGTITVSRADTYGDLIVNYTVDGTAVAGTNYQELPGAVTIPDGATSANIEIYPLRAKDGDHTVEITLADGLYFVDDSAKVATITIKTLVAPEGWNTWVAEEGGSASVAANWSAGSVPTATDKVLFDGRYSTANCEWDAGVNGLPATVAAWRQAEDYTGTVLVDTTYADSFAALNVSGDMEVLTGTLTHRGNSDAETYRLKVLVGGDATIGSSATIDAAGKGFAVNKCRPGSALGCHASPMDSAGVDKLYGDMKKPEALGSGNAKGAGGGAVYIEAAGAFSNDGAITVASAGGAAGSIYIKAASVSGSGTYTARAPDYSQYLAGSGGRIAFELTSASKITEDEDVFINGKCAAGFSFNSRNYAAGGTIFVKSPARANGVLYVSGHSGSGYSYVRFQPEFQNMLAIPAGESWVLDGLVFLNSPIAGLRIPEGTTLSLPSGLTSVKTYGSGAGIGGNGGNIAKGNRGLVVDGGSLVLPSVAEHLIANNWTFQANKPYTLIGNVRVNAGGRIGVVAGYATTYAYTNRCDLTVTGDLTVESKGYIDATGAGWKNYTDAIPASLGFLVSRSNGAHGGVSKDHTDAVNYVYDSILNPMLPGEGAQSGDAGSAEFGGGCVKLTIGGKLTLAGSATALSPYQDVRGGSGGTVNITCGSIEGAGVINVTTQSGYGGTQGGGGRVAIRLTDADADFANYPLSRIVVAQSGSQSSGGTIYLQTAAEGENGGTVYIKGDTSNTATVKTPFPSLYGGGEKDDFKKATLAITSNGKAILSSAAKAHALTMESGTLDLNGKTLKVTKATLGDTKLAVGTYTSSSAEVDGYITDSASGGTLTIQPDGLKFIVR